MTQRLRYGKAFPAGVHALQELGKVINETGLEPSLVELVKTRASQLNGCAYCIDMHTKDARIAGETEQRLYAYRPGKRRLFLHLGNAPLWSGLKPLPTSRMDMLPMMCLKKYERNSAKRARCADVRHRANQLLEPRLNRISSRARNLSAANKSSILKRFGIELLFQELLYLLCLFRMQSPAVPTDRRWPHLILAVGADPIWRHLDKYH